MRSMLLGLVFAGMLLTVAVDGSAADFELKGFTTASFPGDQTPQGLTEACQAEFAGPVRMCNSVEVMETVNWPSLPSTRFAWTHPVLVAAETGTRDYSGAVETATGTLSCEGWTSASSARSGLITISDIPSSPDNAFVSFTSCDFSRVVACCGPVAATMSVATFLPWGHGALATFLAGAATAFLMMRHRLRHALGQ